MNESCVQLVAGTDSRARLSDTRIIGLIKISTQSNRPINTHGTQSLLWLFSMEMREQYSLQHSGRGTLQSSLVILIILGSFLKEVYFGPRQTSAAGFSFYVHRFLNISIKWETAPGRRVFFFLFRLFHMCKHNIISLNDKWWPSNEPSYPCRVKWGRPRTVIFQTAGEWDSFRDD